MTTRQIGPRAAQPDQNDLGVVCKADREGGFNHCPDEEGIATDMYVSHLVDIFRGFNHCPDEEGIATEDPARLAIHVESFNHCPDEEGIAT